MPRTHPGGPLRAGRRLAGLLLVAGVACGASEDRTTAAEPEVSAPPAVAAAPSAPTPAEPGSTDPPAPGPAALPVAGERAADRGAASAPPAPAEPPEPSIAHPPLDALLRAPSPGPVRPTGPPAIDFGAAPPADAPSDDAPPGALERLRQRLLLERRSESIGPAGGRQGTHSETDAGVRVPLDDSISIEGGVRVDERAEPNRESERKSRPQLGIEVLF